LLSIRCSTNEKISALIKSTIKDRVEKETDILQGYNIHFCEPNAFRTKEERISKTLRGSHKQMIESLFTDLEISEDGISPGQACVFYKKDELGYKVLGGGWIKE